VEQLNCQESVLPFSLGSFNLIMFLQNTFRLASRTFKSSSALEGTFWRRLSTHSARTPTSAQASMNLSASKLGLAIGATSALLLHTHSKILNEAVTVRSAPIINTDYSVINPNKVNNPTRSRFGGKLHYKQLSYGSLLGLFAGVVIGKLSSVLAFISLSVFLTAQFLQSRGIIQVPWTSIVRIGSDRVDLRQLLLEDPSFKVSFALTFLIAAFNI
jgi:uncharacterized membrane protein (Fun14 family)